MVHVTIVAVLLVILTVSEMYQTKMLRNKALLSQMINNFQRPKKTHLEPATTTPEPPITRPPDSVISVMQNLLCKNFPDVPCEVIEQDEKLRNLIGLSVREIQEQLTETPSVAVSMPPPRYRNKSSKVSHAHTRKGRKNKRKVYSGGHKMSKFFPHKVKSVRTLPEWRIDYTRHGEPALPVPRVGQMMGKYIQHIHTAPQNEDGTR